MIIRNNKGVSLVQLLVVVAILAILLSAFSDLIVGMQKEVSRMKSKQDRVITNYVVDQALTSQIGITGSAELLPENEMLKACVQGGATSSCASNCCIGEVEQEFILVDPRDSSINPRDRMRLGGTTKSPVYFDKNGNNSCVAPNCRFHVITKFKARCPGGVSSCDHAESLTTSVQTVPEEGKENLIKAQTRNLIYFVNLNYKPFIVAVADQVLTAGSDVTISVMGNAGHPSEVQNFIFETCKANDTAIVNVTCYGFMNGVGTIKISGVSEGSSSVTLKINDGGATNNFSDDLIFKVNVIP